MLDYDIDKMCRVCLQTDLDLFLLFDEEHAIDGVYLFNMISEMTIFTIRRYDDFPHQICLECMQRVRSAYELKKQFERSHRKLLTYLESINKITVDIKPDRQNDKSIQTEDTTLYPCEKCDDMFMNLQDLRRHRETIHKGTANDCRFCPKKFNRIGDLKNHIAMHHSDKKYFTPHECLICSRKFARKEHVHRHMEKIHKIERTNISKEEDNKPNEVKHDVNELDMLLETEEDYATLTKAEDASEIVSNEDTHDYNDDNDNNDDDNVNDDDDNDDDDKSFGTEEHSFSSDDDDKPLANLLNSINSKSKDLENISIKSEPDDSLAVLHTSCDPKLKKEIEIEIETDTKDIPKPEENKTLIIDVSHEQTKRLKKQFKCSVCNKSFARSGSLKRHFLLHSDEKPFQCKFCDKKYGRRDHLKTHMIKHDVTREFKCAFCKRSYDRAPMLKRHLDKYHNPDGSLIIVKSTEWNCEVCKKPFSSKAYLQKHMNKHTNKAWKCKLCPIGFETRAALKEHNKSHGKEKPFLCSECGLRFVRNDYLLIHMRRHTGEKPYTCKYCGKGFPRATDLNVHVKYHTGEKTHLCTVCGKGFQRSYNLVVHMRVHTGERPYKCLHCPKDFAQCNDLKAHVRRHTGERFKCDICGDGFIQGYHLTQHKIEAHGFEGERKGRVTKVKPSQNEIEDADDLPKTGIKSEKKAKPNQSIQMKKIKKAYRSPMTGIKGENKGLVTDVKSDQSIAQDPTMTDETNETLVKFFKDFQPIVEKEELSGNTLSSFQESIFAPQHSRKAGVD